MIRICEHRKFEIEISTNIYGTFTLVGDVIGDDNYVYFMLDHANPEPWFDFNKHARDFNIIARLNLSKKEIIMIGPEWRDPCQNEVYIVLNQAIEQYLESDEYKDEYENDKRN